MNCLTISYIKAATYLFMRSNSTNLFRFRWTLTSTHRLGPRIFLSFSLGGGVKVYDLRFAYPWIWVCTLTSHKKISKNMWRQWVCIPNLTLVVLLVQIVWVYDMTIPYDNRSIRNQYKQKIRKHHVLQQCVKCCCVHASVNKICVGWTQ